MTLRVRLKILKYSGHMNTSDVFFLLLINHFNIYHLHRLWKKKINYNTNLCKQYSLHLNSGKSCWFLTLL